MEQKHKYSYSKHSNSLFTRREAPTSFKREKPANTLYRDATHGEVNIDPQIKTNNKQKGFRAFLKQFQFLGGNKPINHNIDQTEICDETPLADDEVRKLISLYAQYDVLYNPNHSQYGNNQIKTIYYSDIARSFPNKTGAQVEAQIQQLRQLFESEYANIHNAYYESGEEVMPSIKYYKEFHFLEPFLNLNSSCDSLAEETSNMSEVSNTSCKSLYMKHRSAGTISSMINNSLILPTQISGSNCFPCRRKKSNLKKENSDTISEIPEKDEKARETQKRVQIKEENLLEEPTERDTQPQQQNDNSEQEQKQLLTMYQKQPEQEEQPQVEPKQKRSCQSVCSRQAAAQRDIPVPEKPLKVEKLEKACECLLAPRTEKLPSLPCTTDSCRNRIAIIHVSHRQSEGSPEAGNQQNLRYTPVASNTHQPHAAKQTRQINGSQDTRIVRVTNSQPRPDENQRQQLQMLCDMIRTELGAAPDFLYYEAKWRIIEILREVNQRQLMHTKGNSTMSPTEAPKEISGLPRICCQMMASHCPYCTGSSKR